MKKLFYRDRAFWFIWATGAIMILVGIILAFVEETKMYEEIFTRLAGKDFLPADGFAESIHNGDMYGISYHFLNAALILTWAMAAVWCVIWFIREKSGGREFQKLLPVKTKTVLHYEVLMGILGIGLPMTVYAVAMGILEVYNGNKVLLLVGNERLSVLACVENVSMMYFQFLSISLTVYYLLLLARYLTNHVPAMVFTFVVLFVLITSFMWLIAEALVFVEVPYLVWSDCVAPFLCCIFCVILCYAMCEKKDLSASGFFAFKIVQYLVMVVFWIELFNLLRNNITYYHNIINIIAAVIITLAIGAGSYYLVKPKV